MAGRPASRNRHGRPRDPMPGWLPPGSCTLGTVPSRGVIASRASIRRPPPWTWRRFAPPISIRPQQAATDRTPKAGSAGIDHSKQWSGCGAGLPGESLQTTCHGADPQPDKVRSAPFHLCNAPPRPGQAGRDATAPGHATAKVVGGRCLYRYPSPPAGRGKRAPRWPKITAQPNGSDRSSTSRPAPPTKEKPSGPEPPPLACEASRDRIQAKAMRV